MASLLPLARSNSLPSSARIDDMLPVLKTLMSTAWARGKGPKQTVKARSVAPAKAILIAFPQCLVGSDPERRNYTGGRGRNSATGGAKALQRPVLPRHYPPASVTI